MEKMHLPPIVLVTVSTIQLPHGASFYESAIIFQYLFQISLMSFIKNYQGINVRRYFEGKNLDRNHIYIHLVPRILQTLMLLQSLRFISIV